MLLLNTKLFRWNQMNKRWNEKVLIIFNWIRNFTLPWFVVVITAALNWSVSVMTICRKMVDPQITCFEPECCGNLMHGVEFHKFYFRNGKQFNLMLSRLFCDFMLDHPSSLSRQCHHSFPSFSLSCVSSCCNCFECSSILKSEYNAALWIPGIENL